MTSKISIFIPDNLHINQKNFTSFHKFLEKSGASAHFETERKDWIALYGNYESKASVLYERYRVLSHLSSPVLFKYTVKGVNLFKAARAETLALVSTSSTWYDNAYPDSAKAIFEKLYQNNRAILLQNMAAAWDWLDFWSSRLASQPVHTHACIFSGSLIYQRSLMEYLRLTPTKVLVMESFFTGNDYYCEEKYEPIANNCSIRHKAVFNSLGGYDSEDVHERERTKAINKILLRENKNVQQPEQAAPIKFTDPNAPVVAILGQVVNDFSLLEYKQLGLASIAFYKNLILELTRAGLNVVFKAHPWEEKKINIRHSLTRDVIADYVRSLPETLQNRIAIVDHYPLKALFEECTFVTGLNSQGLLEAAFEGLKPVQFGNAFFGQKGFTHDYLLHDISRFVSDISAGNIQGTLTLSEFRRFEEFSTRLLQRQLVSVHDSGVSRLTELFSLPAHIGLVKGKPKQAAANAANGISAPAKTESKAKAKKATTALLNDAVKAKNNIKEAITPSA
ncbi:hypothetical protein [uncultured Azohydromonas sp.]|jgi:Capsule polysaccharide biosynthesis protein.|uniref:capsular polysaccharide export protein, LipB/KpsS family n=1 Tax=uncultured Azohydromonas sp. TaxID=487342 RepID=UPI00261D275D|nr:hypothetical protein [uncultured Azohydromonas sp.]